MVNRIWSTKPFGIDAGLLVLRIGLAWMLMTHGYDKFMTYPQEAATFPDPLGVGNRVSLILTIFAELFCSAFLALGLFTRFALIPLLVTMIVLIMFVHAKDPLDVKEHAILFLVPYITLFLTGPGRYSIDRLLKK